jgi:protease II
MKKEKNKRRQKTGDRRQKSVLCPLLSVLCLFVVAGCAQQQKCKMIEQIHVTDTNVAEAMQIAEDVLARIHFTIEKADANSGVIKTTPLRGAQFFEFWRSDNIGAFNTAEANLHSIRRIVELRISQLVTAQAVAGEGQDEKLAIGCDVQVQRLSLPQRQADSSSQVYQMFSKSSPSMQRLIINPEQKRLMAWIDLGKDTLLETEILKRISSMLDARCSSLDIKHRESSIE